MVPTLTVNKPINFVIPARCEYPQLVWTVYSIINDMPDNHFHIYVVSNGGDEEER